MTQLAPRPMPGATSPAPLLPRTDPIARLPIVILYPHSRCNCRCLMCDIWRVTTREEISIHAVERWLPEWEQLGVRRVVLSGGEPLLHSSFAAMGAVLRDAGIGITLLSTGLLLRRHAADVARFVDDVVVSLDGPRPVHDRIRNIPRAYDKLADGVAAVRDVDASVCVSGRCTVQRDNFRFLRATVQAAREIGLDRISFLAADVSSAAFNRPTGWEPERVHEIALDDDDLAALADELDALETECDAELSTGFVAESITKMRQRLLQYFSALRGSGDFHPIECNAPWVSTVIEVDGTVRPCFFQPPLGNVHDAGSLASVLNSPDAIAWRRGLDTHRNEICRRCVCSLALRRPDDAVSAV
jgi:MoaA/NifB/PqqE/SkfB family radical SAM enzyme